MKKLMILACSAIVFAACDKVHDKAKDTLNKTGERVGEAATEVAEGISEGVERTFDSKIELSEELKAKGLSTGKFYVEEDSITNNDNKLVIYLIADKPIKQDITFKAINKKGTETGRKKIAVDMKAGDAVYQDVVFDPRTDIEVRSTIKIE
ncbi:hypothetical protein LRS05_06360 [Flavobacterium sp. J372]|uniref:hypothetical protein n=1 Tax=Flavobacterium sp. J372 TaxID=2898436 RepID=UPI002151D25E|nr:hypothetical protein [Flavobacterium sp. J372]MCR5861782.1 hypothetical protein [Flavobacterium sp. J372]